MSMPTLIVGLGNPGKKYAATRHNSGFQAVESLRKKYAADLADWTEDARLQSRVSRGRIKDEKVILLQPQTFMNNSGSAAAAAAGFWKVAPARVIVVYDDLDLPLGRIRVRREGSSGGHKGLQSIIERLGTNKIPRVRIGIAGTRRADTPGEDYVLKKFEAGESGPLKEGLDQAVQALELILENSVEAAMNSMNADKTETE